MFESSSMLKLASSKFTDETFIFPLLFFLQSRRNLSEEKLSSVEIEPKRSDKRKFEKCEIQIFVSFLQEFKGNTLENYLIRLFPLY